MRRDPRHTCRRTSRRAFRTLAGLAAAAVVAAASPAAPSGAETPDRAAGDPPAEFETFQLVLLKRPADVPEHSDEQRAEIQRAHLAYLTRLGEEGKIVLAGPFSDQEDERLRGLALYRVGSVEEARRLASADPAVQAGRLEVEAMSWWVEKGYVAFPKAPPPAGAEDGEPAVDR